MSDDGSYNAMVRKRFEDEYLLRSDYVRFHSDPWDNQKGRYRNATMQRAWVWFERGHHAMAKTVKSV